jgi:DNA-binding CsgD family transcriptional regulator/tetratricopeptide (TPR) repeat protein
MRPPEAAPSRNAEPALAQGESGLDLRSIAAHLGKLTAALSSGRGSSVLVEGELGVGKTTALSTVLVDAAAAGCLVLRGSPEGADRGLTLLPEGRGTGGADDDQGGCALRLGGVVSATGAKGVEQVMADVERMCDESPVVLAVDDLHLASQGALLLWHHLSRAAADSPLLLVATCLPTSASDSDDFTRLRRVLAVEGATILRLKPLTCTEAEQLAAGLLGVPPGARLRRRLESAGGNPAYVVDLIESLRQQGAIRYEGRIAEAADPGPVPPALVEAVCARLAPLSADALDVLRLASLLGEEFTGRELVALTGRQPHELLSALDEAIPAGVLEDRGPRLRFRHALVCQALYHSMRETRRSALHRSAAGALDEAGSTVERVAEQLLTAAALAKGWPAEWLAAKADELTFRAPELAIALFRRAIDHAAPDDPARVLFEEKLAAAMYLLGRSDCAPAALGLLEYRADPVRRTTWAFMSGNALNRVGKFAQGLEVVDEGLSILKGESDSFPVGSAPVWSARLLGLRAHLLWADGDIDQARVVVDRALTEGERVGDPLAVFYGAHIHSMLCYSDGDLPGALARIERGLSMLGERWRLVDQRLLLMQNQAVMLEWLDRAAEAHAVLERAYEVAERCGVTWRMAGIVQLSTSFLFAAGRWDEAAAAIRPMIGRPEAELHRSLMTAVLLQILVYRGLLEEARGHLASVLDEKRLSGRLTRIPLLAAALFAEADGRAADAVAALSPALLEGDVWAIDERHYCFPDLTRLALSVGDRETAEAAVAAAEADADHDPANYRRRASARWCRGLFEKDPGLLAQAADYYQRPDTVLMLARVREDSAQVAAALGDVTAARRHLEAAVEGYDTLGAPWAAARADARLREFGVRRGRRYKRTRPDSGWAALTPTEAKIASLVAEGSSNPQIAELLFVSPRTVQTHVSHILAKLGVHSRSEIAREAAAGRH